MTESMGDYRSVGASESLQKFAHDCTSHSFPFYVSIRKKGFNLKGSQHLLYVHERKKIAFAVCVSDKNQFAYTVPVGKESGRRLLPIARTPNPAAIFPSELLSRKTVLPVPSILLVKKSFVAATKGKGPGTVALKEGDLLFPQEIKNKKKATAYLLAVTEKGHEVIIDLKCPGSFSVSFGPDFDLINILLTYKSIIKLPVEVSICQGSAGELESIALLLGIQEELALCGVMTGELGEQKGKIQFMYKANVPTILSYTAQKMVPRDPTSKTAMKLKTNYEKAVKGQRAEDACTYDDPFLDHYETVDMELTSNPAYGIVAAANVVTAERPSVKREGSHQVRVVSNCRPAPQEAILHKPAARMPLFDASAKNSAVGKQPKSQSPREVHTNSTSEDLRCAHVPMNFKVPVADKLPREQHPEADVQSHESLSRDKNVAFLRSLGIEMIQRLLVGMHLSEHRDRFLAEHIDGDILACCDSDCLHELGVTSHIQQLRLAKLIDGTHSAVKFLN